MSSCSPQSDRELEIANRMRDGALLRAQRATINKDLADATVQRDVKKLKPVISKAEKKRVSGTENYLLQAKKLYEQLQAATQLKGATFDRRIADIEAAIHAIKKGGFETLLAVELLEAQVKNHPTTNIPRTLRGPGGGGGGTPGLSAVCSSTM